jgi:hypothetical protein
MKQGKTRLFCAAEHRLPVGVVLLALFWVIKPLLKTLFAGDVVLLSMLLPAQPLQSTPAKPST